MRTSRPLTSVPVKVAVAGVLVAVGMLVAASPSTAADHSPTTPTATPSAIAAPDRSSGAEGDTMQAAYTTGFQVNNATTSYVLSFNHLTGDGNVESAPPVANWARPGEFHRYELTSYLFKQENDVAVYDVLKLDADGNGTRVGELKVTMRESRIYNRTNFMTASTTVAGLSIQASGQASDSTQPYVTVSESGAQTITLGPDQPAAQGAVIALIGRPLVTSSYKPIRQYTTIGHPYLVGSAVKNYSAKVLGSTTIGGSETHGVDSSFTVGSEVTVEYGPVAASISATWGKTVSTSTTVEQSITLDVPAYTKVWIEAESEVTRVTGDFTVTIGNTTYLLKDTTLDFPQKGGKTEYTLKDQDLSGKVTTLRKL